MKNISATIERIRELLADAQIEPLAEELNSYHSADLADILQELKEDERLDCFKLIELDKAAEIIEYLSPQLQVELLGAIDEERASKIITMMPHDAAADVLGDMEEDESETYLDKLPQKFSDEVRELLTYNEETAGGLMNPIVMTVFMDMTVQQVLDYVRIKAEEDNLDLYYIYVIDKQNNLIGVV